MAFPLGRTLKARLEPSLQTTIEPDIANNQMGKAQSSRTVHAESLRKSVLIVGWLVLVLVLLTLDKWNEGEEGEGAGEEREAGGEAVEARMEKTMLSTQNQRIR